MSKELRIPHSKIRNSQTITDVVRNEFKKHGLNIHVNEVEELIDDEKNQERILKVKNTKYFYSRLP